uniref:Peroxide stress protein YaaA n=1 Tax=Heterorhabditis bacteriophora TaxID=37862 RepID=A0A1I7WB07_HETBA
MGKVNIILSIAPPNLVSAENRKNAEQLFHNMKKEMNIETATHVLLNDNLSNGEYWSS